MGNRFTTGEGPTHFRPDNRVRARGLNDGFASDVAVSLRTLPLERDRASGELRIQRQHVVINADHAFIVSVKDACAALLARAEDDAGRYAEGFPVGELRQELCSLLMARLPAEIFAREDINAVVLDYGYRLGRELSFDVRTALASVLEPEGYTVHQEVLQYPITREKRFIKDAILLGKGAIDLHEVVSPWKRVLRRFRLSS